MVTKFRTRVAELEAERHSTNEALDDVAQELRRRANCGRPDCGHWGGFHSVENGCQAHVQSACEPVEYCPCSEFVAEAGES
jgi:hypothetical protein